MARVIPVMRGLRFGMSVIMRCLGGRLGVSLRATGGRWLGHLHGCFGYMLHRMGSFLGRCVRDGLGLLGLDLGLPVALRCYRRLGCRRLAMLRFRMRGRGFRCCSTLLGPRLLGLGRRMLLARYSDLATLLASAPRLGAGGHKSLLFSLLFLVGLFLAFFFQLVAFGNGDSEIQFLFFTASDVVEVLLFETLL